MFATGPAFFGVRVGAPPTTLTITGTFASAVVGVAYSSSLPLSGGTEPYSLTGGSGVASGTLDTGFTLSITGSTGAYFLTLSCASPATADTMTFTGSVNSTDGQTATSAQSVVVAAPNVSLDLGMTGVDGGTTFTDASPHHFSITRAGDTHTQATGVPAGGTGGSATYFDGTGDYLFTPADDALSNFGTGDFSIEVEAYAAATSSEQVLVASQYTWPTDTAFVLEIRSGGDLRFYAGLSNAMQIFGGTGSFTAAAWHVVKVKRVSGVTTLSVDGVSVGTHTGSVNVQSPSNSAVVIGAFPEDKSSRWIGYMRKLKITKG